MEQLGQFMQMIEELVKNGQSLEDAVYNSSFYFQNPLQLLKDLFYVTEETKLQNIENFSYIIQAVFQKVKIDLLEENLVTKLEVSSKIVQNEQSSLESEIDIKTKLLIQRKYDNLQLKQQIEELSELIQQK